MRDVSLTYHPPEGPVPAVRGVNLSVGAGEVVGVAGESGCGKSTLISTVLRLYPKNATVEGEVLIDGEDVFQMKWNRIRAVRWGEAAVVFQGALHSLNPIQRIGKQLAEPIFVHDKGATEASAAKKVRELLDQVGLPARHANAYPHQLSGGQKQRIMIALALTCDPKVLLCDEPTTALDVMGQAQILDLLKGIARDRSMGMLIISHDLSVLASNCDRISIMYAGRVIEQGVASELFAEPAHPYTRALMGAFPTIGDAGSRYAPSGLPGDPPFPGDLPSGCSFHPRCPIATVECESVDVGLLPVGISRQVACIHVNQEVVAS
ncbi:MAG: ABC transporter ATP-binding protein [Actinomycetia bacterium]|nr:ABC transporter ATP-binding protein [Actinomycetes bacterium]